MDCVQDPVANEAAPAVDRGLAETVLLQETSHLAVSPFLEMEAIEGVPEIAGDIMRAGESMRCVENVDASWLEEAVGKFEVEIDVVGVKVFEELVAESQVGAAVGEVEVIAIVDDKLKIPGEDLAGRALVGNVDPVDMRAPLRCRSGEAAVTGGEFDQDRLGAGLGKVRAEEAELRLNVAPRSLRRFATGEPWMIRNPLKKFGIECLEKRSSLFPGGGAEPRGELLFHFVVVAELVRGSGGRWHGAGDEGRGARDEGGGTREEGRGTR